MVLNLFMYTCTLYMSTCACLTFRVRVHAVAGADHHSNQGQSQGHAACAESAVHYRDPGGSGGG